MQHNQDSNQSGDAALDPVKEEKKKQKELKKLEQQKKFEAKQEKLKAEALARQEKQKNDPKPKKEKEKPAVEETPYIDTTVPGQKKVLGESMQSAYKPKEVESSWYSWWESQSYFKPCEESDKGVYVIPIPPPNVTGALHLGHTLTNSIQDSLMRWKRMQGYKCLYIPGCDHAGIATQAVVEKKLMREEGKSKHDLGREAFIAKVFEWKELYGDRIYNQLRKLGSSYDWSKVCFTLDDRFVQAVQETFCRLFDEGTIYRDTRLVYWSCALNTALSDLEVDNVELTGRTLLSVPGHKSKVEFGVIVSFKYPLETSGYITVATTRLETMLGDVAIAVHPNDPRYSKLVGSFAIHPFNGRKIKIIADETVEIEFGTGAVKITPAHDENDFKIGKKHNLQFINIFNNDGSINEHGAPFTGMMRFDARVKVMEALKELGLYVETKDNPMVLPICSRTGDVAEYLNKPQWYVSCKSMAERAMEVCKTGDLKINPKLSEREWFDWLGNIQDWCISRQLWWGHRIPAFYVNIEGEPDKRDDGTYWVAARTEEEALKKAFEKFKHIPKEKIKLDQDEDVLDTWFSSALWPFATLGWPEKTSDLEMFYPNSLLETGWDILFFWVARMVMLGLKLTDKVPFKEVFCHAMVRDSHGRKMSKSEGNVIDPLDVINGCTLEYLHDTLRKGNLDPKKLEVAISNQKRDFPSGIPECGTDALRFALCAYQGTNRDINLDLSRVEGYRKFCNKVWNACRFVLIKLGDNFKPSSHLLNGESLVEKWILKKLNTAISDYNNSMAEYNFMNATTAIHKFFLYELCDVFIEVSKLYLNENDNSENSVAQTLYTCVEQALKLMHPMMPFITEELYQRLPRRSTDKESIMISKFPEVKKEWDYTMEESNFETIQSISRAARSLLADYDVRNPSIYVKVDEVGPLKDLVKEEQKVIELLIFSKGLTFTITEQIPNGCAVIPLPFGSVYLLVRGVVDLDKEIDKLSDKMKKSLDMLSKLKEKTQGPDYTTKVKEEVREANDQRMKNLESEIETLKKGISNFEKLK